MAGGSFVAVSQPHPPSSVVPSFETTRWSATPTPTSNDPTGWFGPGAHGVMLVRWCSRLGGLPLHWINDEPGELRFSKPRMLRVGLETMRSTPRDVAREVDENPMDRGGKSRLRTLLARQVTHDVVPRVPHGVAAVRRATARSRRGPISAGGRPVRVSPPAPRCR